MSKSGSWLKVSCICRLEILIFFCFSFKATQYSLSFPSQLNAQHMLPTHIFSLLCLASTSTQTSLSVSFYMLNMQEAKFR